MAEECMHGKMMQVQDGGDLKMMRLKINILSIILFHLKLLSELLSEEILSTRCLIPKVIVIF